ncbi:rod shape-determining protein MreD [Candidatus Tenderia electrophaga]|jgi:rod shape-determining protein MreD|uniref:Rod shape-determining protein MreD n=1 Tax=Candidatus Tenderia electrophaga TaxID=1748243 RepID=A0A0S2TGW6_9GAMM|nr:rod shape-determining protein MreD [Candidatus Tenderia electrophaga]
MAQVTRGGGMIIIGLTYVAALILTLIPLPQWMAAFRPEWLALVLIYWCMALPHRIGIFTAFGLGLMLDVLKGALLGQHALALVVVVYLTQKVYQQIRIFPMWQQALSIMGLLILYQVLVMWVNGITDLKSSSWSDWLPAVSSTLLWPWIYLILRDIRRHFGIK